LIVLKTALHSDLMGMSSDNYLRICEKCHKRAHRNYSTGWETSQNEDGSFLAVVLLL